MSYAGDVTCRDCWEDLSQQVSAQLIDVRTIAEWSFVGVPDLSAIAKHVHLVEWQRFPSMELNPGFVEDAATKLSSSGADKDSNIYVICRSGARSMAAADALAAAGYKNAFNVLSGFEGPSDRKNRRGTVAGWKVDGLPWKQN